jgi:hypothetical protein
MDIYRIEPLSLFNVITHPTVTDLLPPGEGAYDAATQDFLVMDNVPYKRPIVDITPMYNILQRREASCEIIYKQIGRTGLRDIETAKLYTATKNCREEFYQGALRDWQNDDMETFGAKITPFFLKATRTDIGTNIWFGDTSRAISSSLQYSVTQFDGIVKWLQVYTNSGVINSAQTVSPGTSNFYDPAYWEAAFNLLTALIQNQTILFRNIPNAEKVIYCDTSVLYGYTHYLQAIGTSTDYIIKNWIDGLEVPSIDGIAIRAVSLWEPVLYNINGNAPNHHLVILTIKRNFIFATDKEYGEGPDGRDALQVYYWMDTMEWKWRMFLKAGTQIALPEFIVWGMS